MNATKLSELADIVLQDHSRLNIITELLIKLLENAVADGKVSLSGSADFRSDVEELRSVLRTDAVDLPKTRKYFGLD